MIVWFVRAGFEELMMRDDDDASMAFWWWLWKVNSVEVEKKRWLELAAISICMKLNQDYVHDV